MTPERRTSGEQIEEGAGLGTANGEQLMPGLPAWESFATADR